jgi:hypothetical protein
MKKLVVFIAAITMVAGFAMTAAAAEWNFYGSARVATFYNDWDGEDFVNGIGDDTDLDLTHAVQGNSRIGANVKVSDELSGRFEYGTGVNVRLLYGTWNFGSGKLSAGQMYTPLNMFYSNQVYGSDNNMLNYGGVYGGRNGAIQLQFGSFKIAFVTPNTTTIAGVATDPDVVIPRIEASYHLDLGDAFVDLQGGYMTYDMETVAKDYDVDCYVLALGAGMNMGNFYLKGDIWMGQNVGPYGLYNAGADDPIVVIGDSVKDNDSFGFLLVAGAKISDMLSVEAGYGYTQSELDISGADKDDTSAYYVQSTVNLAPGVFIVPEIGYIDGEENAAGVDEPDTLYYGLKWQINF